MTRQMTIDQATHLDDWLRGHVAAEQRDEVLERMLAFLNRHREFLSGDYSWSRIRELADGDAISASLQRESDYFREREDRA